jgi:N-acetylmuramoyl-L-alanine amidase
MTIILDPAHGKDTPGKGSPCGTHKEWSWSRALIARLTPLLRQAGFDVILSNTQEVEIGLNNRVKEMNRHSDAFVLSLHNNAAGMGNEWKNARGFSVWTTKGKTKSDNFATIIYNKIRKAMPDLPFRTDFSDGDPDWEANFTVLTSRHPSVMLEWMFQDNKEDLKIIQDPEMNETLALVLLDSLIEIRSQHEK